VVGTVPAGWATDKYTKDSRGRSIPGAKKLLLALGQALSGLFYFGYASWWMPADSSSPQSRAVLIFILQLFLGFVNPLFMVPALPDMHECHNGQPSEDTTNLISAVYTTMMNLGGVIGPILANAFIPTIGFRNMIAGIGAFFMATSCVVLLYVRTLPRGGSGGGGGAAAAGGGGGHDGGGDGDSGGSSMYSVLSNGDDDDEEEDEGEEGEEGSDAASCRGGGAGTGAGAGSGSRHGHSAERVGLLSVAKAREAKMQAAADAAYDL
jgi:MFS family permease